MPPLGPKAFVCEEADGGQGGTGKSAYETTTTHIEVGDHGLEFIRKNIESPAESNDLMKQKINEFGKAAYMKKDFPKAITIYEKVMEMDTEDVTYWGNLSAVMFELKAWKEV